MLSFVLHHCSVRYPVPIAEGKESWRKHFATSGFEALFVSTAALFFFLLNFTQARHGTAVGD